MGQNGSWAFNSEFPYFINHQGNGPSDFISWHENRFFVYIPDAQVPQAWNDSAEGDSFPQTSLRRSVPVSQMLLGPNPHILHNPGGFQTSTGHYRLHHAIVPPGFHLQKAPHFSCKHRDFRGNNQILH